MICDSFCVEVEGQFYNLVYNREIQVFYGFGRFRRLFMIQSFFLLVLVSFGRDKWI